MPAAGFGPLAALLLAAAAPAPAACAAYDVHVLTLLEDAAEAGAETQALRSAAATLAEARGLCRAGEVAAAIEAYQAAEARLPRVQAWLR